MILVADPRPFATARNVDRSSRRRAAIGDRGDRRRGRRRGLRLGGVEPALQILGLRARATQVALEAAGGAARFCLLEPGGDAAHDHPYDQRGEEREEERHARDGGGGVGGERIEREDDARAVRHREQHDENCERHQDEGADDLADHGRSASAPADAASAGTIEALAHFLAGLEERHALLVDRYVRAGARVAAGARRPMLDRERAEAAQLDTVAARERVDDFAEDRVDDVLDVALIKVRILRGDTLDQFRLDHRHLPPLGSTRGSVALVTAIAHSGTRAAPAQLPDGGCQRANRPSRLRRSIACTVPEPSMRRASEPRPTASSTADAARWSIDRSPSRDLSCQSRTGSFASMPFSLASQASAVCSLPSSSTSLRATAWRPVKMRPSETRSSSASSRWRRSCTMPRNQA